MVESVKDIRQRPDLHLPMGDVERAAMGREVERRHLLRGLERYRELQGQLEQSYPGQYVTLDATSGDFATGASALSAMDAFEALFQRRQSLTFHIGST